MESVLVVPSLQRKAQRLRLRYGDLGNANPAILSLVAASRGHRKRFCHSFFHFLRRDILHVRQQHPFVPERIND